jgi:hypothetical protein
MVVEKKQTKLVVGKSEFLGCLLFGGCSSGGRFLLGFTLLLLLLLFAGMFQL